MKMYGAGTVKIGMDMDKGMDIGSTCPMLILSIPAPYLPHMKPVPFFFKVLICCLHLDTLLVALNCIVFKTSMRHFAKNCNC